MSYPTSAYGPASKSNGDTIQASWFNDPDAEITAIETALLTGGLAHNLFPSGTRTLGTSSAFWDKVYGTALIVGAETTSGARLDIEAGVLAVREGDDSAYAPLKALTLETTGDIFTTAWTDYTASSTITGWSGTPTKLIKYKKVGKLVFFAFVISGTSDATSVSFTLPHATVNNSPLEWGAALFEATDNGAALTAAARWTMPNNSALVTCYANMGTGAWTGSNTKTVRGIGWYETA